ncbi:hypothetical protein [Caballeronia sp. BCC1704]|uniref:hypothetical protein n=1 Tax=Caballeronia sp. BCC1704 TaxID=2676300 RepID=UPI0015889D88|nr:hypothetical protein [Caballeronia sp. BCC1704]
MFRAGRRREDFRRNIGGRREARSAQIIYRNPAYELSIDTSIDFDNGKSQGVGVSTGEGRDANGMHYWKILANGRTMLDLGDAPALSNDRFMKGYFSTLISGSGQYQAYRYFYTISDNRLVLGRAIGFKWNDDATGAAVSMEVAPDGNFVELGQKTLNSAEIEDVKKVKSNVGNISDADRLIF